MRGITTQADSTPVPADAPCIGVLKKGTEAPRSITGAKTDEAQSPVSFLRSGLHCAICGHVVTSSDQRVDVGGGHAHTFANPGGYIFHIGCFRTVPGCLISDEESTSFTWFSGYAWSFAACARCSGHLGWQFRSPSDRFFGLVLSRLIEKQDLTDAS
ncbi:MAG: cereblon family protein [Myxococcota bacterium]|nr:cereblon family protein [Myxococcota bacterium]